MGKKRYQWKFQWWRLPADVLLLKDVKSKHQINRWGKQPVSLNVAAGSMRAFDIWFFLDAKNSNPGSFSNFRSQNSFKVNCFSYCLFLLLLLFLFFISCFQEKLCQCQNTSSIRQETLKRKILFGSPGEWIFHTKHQIHLFGFSPPWKQPACLAFHSLVRKLRDGNERRRKKKGGGGERNWPHTTTTFTTSWVWNVQNYASLSTTRLLIQYPWWRLDASLWAAFLFAMNILSVSGSSPGKSTIPDQSCLNVISNRTSGKTHGVPSSHLPRWKHICGSQWNGKNFNTGQKRKPRCDGEALPVLRWGLQSRSLWGVSSFTTSWWLFLGVNPQTGSKLSHGLVTRDTDLRCDKWHFCRL